MDLVRRAVPLALLPDDDPRREELKKLQAKQEELMCWHTSRLCLLPLHFKGPDLPRPNEEALFVASKKANQEAQFRRRKVYGTSEEMQITIGCSSFCTTSDCRGGAGNSGSLA